MKTCLFMSFGTFAYFHARLEIMYMDIYKCIYMYIYLYIFVQIYGSNRYTPFFIIQH